MPLAIGFFILLMVTSLIVLYKDCDSFAEYLFSTILGVVLSAFIAFLFAIIICGIVIFVEPAKTTQTYSITALSDNFSSYVGRYYTEDDEGYKICNEFGGRTYYQSDFLSLLKSGHIVYCPDENKYEIKHIICAEKISNGAILIHEFDSVEEV